MNKLIFIVVGAGLLLARPAGAAELVIGDHFACSSRDGFEEAGKAMVAGDETWFRSIAGCGFTTPGSKVVVLERFAASNGHPAVKVKVIGADKNGTFTLWTIAENVVPAGQ